jgi:hypothetical protein
LEQTPVALPRPHCTSNLHWARVQWVLSDQGCYPGQLGSTQWFIETVPIEIVKMGRDEMHGYASEWRKCPHSQILRRKMRKMAKSIHWKVILKKHIFRGATYHCFELFFYNHWNGIFKNGEKKSCNCIKIRIDTCTHSLVSVYFLHFRSQRKWWIKPRWRELTL